MMREIPLTSRWYQARVRAFTSENCRNFYPEVIATDNGDAAKSRFILKPTPGLKLFADTGVNSGIRAARTRISDGTLFVIVGQSCYAIGSDGSTALQTGTISGTGLCTMTDNGTQVAICNGSSLWIVNAGVAAEITDPDFPGAATIDFMDGYGIFPKPDSDQYYITDLYDFTSVDALDFASAEKRIDKLLRSSVLGEYLYHFGGATIEIHYNSGAAAFPFERASGGVINLGLGAVHSVAELDNTLFFVASDGTVRRLAGSDTPTRISNHPLDELLTKRGHFEDLEAFAYVQGGHSFYELTIPGVGTYAYDVATGLWHDRYSTGEQRHRVRAYVKAYEKHIVGDYRLGKLYQLDSETFTDNGAAIEREVVLPQINAKTERGTLHMLQVQFGAGVGTLTGQGVDPQVMACVSKDCGYTWGTERWVSIGKRGEYKNRARWGRWGRFREALMVKLRITDPVDVSIMAAFADFGG